jgi:hypothetical protein
MQLLASHDGYTRLPVLDAAAVIPFAIPGSTEAVLTYRGVPYNVLEDLIPTSAAWKQVAPILLRSETPRQVGQSLRFTVAMSACCALLDCWTESLA